ncbi:hypothetical protein WR25_20008 isoform G [Diploscapter pachys]|uniref:Phospholipid/glycerol acyltransferase domain-containing protein n=2 Tax=Diploscapter pachys TaxID=2018661 RepID=A0A2A2LDW4_9BILA|nr:hypothetical protein WR25_20008 isoform E [Diploscapter pachys]PAV84426.1 hypothetical protein WR25_20008 isoform F [Diploscapter pachys]PAV84427.1 hypothetical protein WR25_20008 isoform G [Diploscapter pachys]
MWWLLSLYLRTLFGAYLIQLLSTFIELPSIQLSSIYLSIVGFIQSLYPEVYPKSQHYPGIREKTLGGEFVRNVDSSCHFNFLADNQYQNINAFEIASLTFKAGINAIDDLSPAFDRAPTYGESLLRFAPLPHWSMPLKILFYATLVFRLAILFPLRVAFFISSFVFIGILGIYAVFTELTDRQKTLIGPIYGKLFCLGTGTIIVGHNRQNMPRKPGIAVSNHLSPNDVQILFADLRYGDLQYVVTGQKHKGVIGIDFCSLNIRIFDYSGLVEKMVSRLCRALWFERGNTKERMEFLTDVINMARADGPVLLFPEGYCTNNTSVLQFRKAVFEEDVNIYPIAISQSGIYGDSYWFEDKFHMYLLRLFFSWAVVYNVHYLPSIKNANFIINFI